MSSFATTGSSRSTPVLGVAKHRSDASTAATDWSRRGLVNAHTHSQSSTMAGFGDRLSHPAFMWLTQAHTSRRTPDEIRLTVLLTAYGAMTSGTTAIIDHFPGQRFTRADMDACRRPGGNRHARRARCAFFRRCFRRHLSAGALSGRCRRASQGPVEAAAARRARGTAPGHYYGVGWQAAPVGLSRPVEPGAVHGSGHSVVCRASRALRHRHPHASPRDTQASRPCAAAIWTTIVQQLAKMDVLAVAGPAPTASG